MTAESRIFGYTRDGEPVLALTLDNGYLSCEILTFGAVLYSLLVPDRNGTKRDVVLGYHSVAEYEKTTDYLGSIVGRYANRIACGRFCLNGNLYTLATNNGSNHLHGGNCGFSHRLWTVQKHTPEKLILSIDSPDGQEGYPGRLRVEAEYCLENNALQINYRAVSDADTICNLTNHSYFNLNGHSAGSLQGQSIQIFADHYTPTDEGSIPLPGISSVEDTPMDLREETDILSRLSLPFHQLLLAKGFDHNFVLNDNRTALQLAAQARAEESGITLQVETTMPGLQFYTANFLTSALAGKDGASYGIHHGFCLETQYFPDSPNRPDFPSVLLKAGELYQHSTRFIFSNS